MEANQKNIDKALQLQRELEKKILSKPGVHGIAISTLPDDHTQVCIKIIVSDAKYDYKNLNLESSYYGIPIVFSVEDIKPL